MKIGRWGAGVFVIACGKMYGKCRVYSLGDAYK
jgi:hypothetical protein